MDLTIEILTNSGVAVLIANIITMFIKDEKAAEFGPIVKAVVALLNAVSLNVFGNKNGS